MQVDETRQSGGVLEAASRLVGEVHMAKPGVKSIGTPSVLMKEGQAQVSSASFSCGEAKREINPEEV